MATYQPHIQNQSPNSVANYELARKYDVMRAKLVELSRLPHRPQLPNKPHDYRATSIMQCAKCNRPLIEGEWIYRNHTRTPRYEADIATYKGWQFWHYNCANTTHLPGQVHDNNAPTNNTSTITAKNDTFTVKVPTPPAPSQNGHINEGPPKEGLDALLAAIFTSLSAVYDPRIDALEATTTEHSARISDIHSNIQDTRRDILNLDAAAILLAARIAALEASKPNIISVTLPDGTTTHNDVGRQHKLFDKLMRRINAGDRNIQLMGPAGSGKSEAAKAVAKGLGYHFELVPIISDPVDILGYQDANGKYVPTNFFRAFTGTYGPAVILLDEMDGWDARAGLAVNPALANGHCAFPHGTFMRGGPESHDVIVMAATNTWGFGGDADYVGRNKLDGTTLDRLSTIPWSYDEEFEAHLAGTNSGNADVDSYVKAIQATRALCLTHKAKLQITPRASIAGAILLRGGIPRDEVLEARLGRFQTHNMWPTVGKPLIDWAAHADSNT